MGITELMLLGAAADPNSERGVSCEGQLPAASDKSLVEGRLQQRRP